MNSNILKELNKEFGQKRIHSEEKRAELVQALFTKYPALKDIQDEISKTGINYSKSLLSARGDASEIIKIKDAYHDQIDILSKQKAALYHDIGLDVDYADSCYECKNCKDSGIIISKHGVRNECTCYKMRKLNLLFSCSNFPMLQSQVFNSFDPTLYSDDINDAKYRLKISPRQNIKKIKNVCDNFINNFNDPNVKNLFFSGAVGLGKTFISGCIANEIINKGFSLLYLSAGALFEIMAEHKMQVFNNKFYDDFKYKYIFECNLLIIDDLGTEASSDSRYSSLLSIIDSRISTDREIRKTIISSNVNISKLYEYYTERVASRIIGNFDILSFIGEDIRIKKVLNR
ncbi:MAG TPA: ATP-binding protein [Clostridia bacterium]|nr:ATP-binding protein [Clostridia bacterium]